MRRIERLLAVWAIGLILMINAAVPVLAKPNYAKLYGEFLHRKEIRIASGRTLNGKREYYYLNPTVSAGYYYNKKTRKKEERRTLNPSVRFMLLDLDRNGTKELLLTEYYENVPLYDLFIFTIKKGKVVYCPYKGNDDRFLYLNSTKIRYSKKTRTILDIRVDASNSSEVKSSSRTSNVYGMKKGKICQVQELYRGTVKNRGIRKAERFYSYLSGKKKIELTSYAEGGYAVKGYDTDKKTYLKTLSEYKKLYKKYANNSKYKTYTFHKLSEKQLKKYMK